MTFWENKYEFIIRKNITSKKRALQTMLQYLQFVQLTWQNGDDAGTCINY